MPNRFDVFLSHAIADKPLVETLAVRLKREGIEPWLDKWHLVPGEPWQPGLARGLAESETCAAFVGPGGFGSWQEEELRAAINRRVTDRSRAFRVIPVLLPGVERPERAKLPEFLTATTWVEFRASIDEDEPFRRLVCGIRGLEPEFDPAAAPFAGECPYRGLEFFDFNDRDPRFFCGREAQVDDLLTMLRDTLPTDPRGGALRFLAILGASGSGKSSLARAGLLPALRAGALEGSQNWPIAIARPGREPLTGLATALNSLDGAAALGTYDRVARQADGERSLHVAARLILGEPPRAGRLVVLVDQFEEVFTLCEDEDERRALIANLLHAAKAPDGPTAVVLTMRADFLPRCAPYSALAAAVTGRQYLVEPMRRDDLRRAIERPARIAGLEPEPGLADLLLDDAEENPGSLPLLEFVLKELWVRRRGHKLAIEAYRDLGGMKQAVAKRADAVLAELEKHGRGEITKRIFLSLVKLGEGTEDTRRRAPIAELVPAGGNEAAVQEVLRVLTDREARLVTTSRDGTVEVAHEALIRSWPTLRRWVDADREGGRIKQRLDEAATEWARHDRNPGYLDHGPRLALARKWSDDHPGALSALAVDFLTASLAREHSEEAARLDEARDRAELAEARRQAEQERAEKAELYAQEAAARQESERLRAEEAEARKRDAEAAAERQKRLGYRFLVAAVVACVLAITSGGLAMRANKARKDADSAAATATRNKNDAIKARVKADAATQRATEAALLAKENEEKANAQARIATSRQLAALSVSERNKRLDLSLLLAVEALRTEHTSEARDSLFKALHDRPGIRSFLHAREGTVGSVAFSPDGNILAAGCSSFGFGFGGGVVLWDVSARKRLAEDPLPVREGYVDSVAFSPDGHTLAAGYDGVGGGGGVVLWDVSARKRLAEEPLPVREGKVGSVVFSPDSHTLAAGYSVGEGGGVVLWDVSARKRLAEEPLPVRGGRVQSVAFSPDGTTLAAGYIGRGVLGGVVLWDVSARKRLAEDPLPVSEGSVGSVAFSPDGTTLAAGYSGRDGGGVVLWDVSARKRLAEDPLPVREGYVGSVAFSPDGHTLAAGYSGFGGGGVVLWDVSARKRLAEDPLPVREGYVGSVAFSPDGQTLAAAYSGGGGVVLWDVSARKRLAEDYLPVREGDVGSVAFSPDGHTLAAGYGGGGGGVVLWDVSARKRLAEDPLPVREGYVGSVAFSPDGHTLAAGYGGGGGGVVLWDVSARKRLAEDPLPVREGVVGSVAFSPDGHTLAAGYRGGGGVVLWDVSARKRLAEDPLPVREGDVWSVAFSPDGHTLAAGYGVDGGGSGVVLWDVSARKRLAEDPLPVREGYVGSVAFSPDGTTLAAGYSGRDGGGVVLWDVSARKRLAEDPLPVREGYVGSVAFSPDGHTLAAGYGDGVVFGGVVLWDVSARKRLAEDPLPVREGDVVSVAFSPDGHTLAAGYRRLGGEGGVVLYDVDLNSWQRLAGRIANRNFTRDEWRQYFPEAPYRPTFPDLPIPRMETSNNSVINQ